MGFAWQPSTNAPVPPDGEAFVEVIYGRNDILSVHLPPDLTRNEALADALMDVIATCGQREAAEDGIEGLASRFGLDVHPVAGRGERLITLSRRSPEDQG